MAEPKLDGVVLPSQEDNEAGMSYSLYNTKFDSTIEKIISNVSPRSAKPEQAIGTFLVGGHVHPIDTPPSFSHSRLRTHS
jgi:hypothetical protein